MNKKDKAILIVGILILCCCVSATSFLAGICIDADDSYNNYVDVKENTIKTEWINNCRVFDFSDAVNEDGGITSETTKNLTLVLYNTLQDFTHYRLLLIKPQDWFMGEYGNGGVDFWKYYNAPPMMFEATCPSVSKHRTMFTPGKKYIDTYLPLGSMWGDNPQIHFNINLSMTLFPCTNQSYVPDEFRSCHVWIVWNDKAMIVPFRVKT